jgi:NADPH:quinone reductase-like Zn-dependent oxidoreductase
MGNRQDFRDVVSLVARGDLEPEIDRVLPLEKTAEGHAALEDRSVVGKVVIVP